LAERAGVEEAQVLLYLLAVLDEACTSAEEAAATALRAAQTCLVAHSFVRRGHAPWGIQKSLDRTDMLAVNQALGKVLIVAACASAPGGWTDVVEVLLQEVHHLLRAQARAASVTVEDLVAQYFMALAARDASSD